MSMKEEAYILDYHLEVSNVASILNLKVEDNSTQHKGKFKLQVAKAEQIECPFCGLIFPTKLRFRNHKRKHLTRDCQNCGKSLSKGSNFQDHLRRCTKDVSLNHLCTICNKTFYTLQELNGHRERRHTARILTKLYQCEICDFEISNQKIFRKHITSHKVHKTYDNYMAALQSEELKKCPKCDKHYMKESLARHMKSHNFIKCNMCDYKSKYTSNLKAHTWRIHMKPKVVQSESDPKALPKCSFCDFTSKTPYNVIRHQESCSFAGPEIFCIV